MKNCEMKVKDGKLIITVDLSKEFGPSGSGKTIIVASTSGNHVVAEANVTVGLNVYKKPETK
jgi:ABC-type molybdate transport system ATPase subunit